VKNGDRLLDASAIGQRLSGKSPRTGRRFIDEGHISVYLVRGKRYVRESELDQWLELQKIEVEPAPNVTGLKGMLQAISEKVLRERKKAGAA
jgi:hypothetical protein